MNGGGDRPSLEAVDLTATYRGRAGEAVQALTDISTSFRPGHLAVVLGPSGSGKSTLLHSGGHSFGAFGLVNPIAAMSQAVVELYRTQVPARPKTIYSASVTGGGTSVNSIPNEVWMEFDMRSEHAGELDKLEKHFLTILNQAVETENNARSAKEGVISVDAKLVGDRPTGQTNRSSDIVQFAAAAYTAHGIKPEYRTSSTDSNMPMSLKIQALTMPRADKGGRAHSLDEWADVEKESNQKVKLIGLTTILAVAGLDASAGQ